MQVPLLDLKAQYAGIRDEVRSAVDQVLESQRFILGPHVEALEKEIAGFCGVSHAVGLASGTDALLLSLKAVGVGPGSAVVTVPYTFFATAGAIVNLGARPLFVDIGESGFNVDPGCLSSFLREECSFNLTTRCLVHKASHLEVRAILPVHLYGQCADMREIMEIAERYRLPVVEDSCQALGARYEGRAAGTIGDCGCISFFPSKNLGGAGDGGMMVTGSEEIASRVRLLRTHGGVRKYYHSVVGYNSRLDELQAAILRVKLGHLADWNEGRRRNAAAYENDFIAAGLSGFVRTPTVLPGRDHIYHQYVIRCQRRDELKAHLAAKGIGTEIYYPVSLHEQECFAYLGYRPSDFPHSRKAAQETLSLPVYAELSPEQRSFVVSSIAEFYLLRK
jgi:dTDP-4-amino-4,6-dideoxygalactose transaminase